VSIVYLQQYRFALGIESDFGNVTQCLKDGDQAFISFNKAFKELSDGISKRSPSIITLGIIDLGEGVKELAIATKACDTAEIVSDIERIAHELSSGAPGIIEIVIKESINIFAHKKEITQDIQRGVSYWNQQKYELCGVQVGKLVGFLIKYGQQQQQQQKQQL
jgi:hypothetical protein